MNFEAVKDESLRDARRLVEDYGFDLSLLTGAIAGSMLKLIEAWQDKVKGLEADLDSAVEVAWNRGATDWVRMNYPAAYKRLNASEDPSHGL